MTMPDRRASLERMLDVAGTLAQNPDAADRLLRAFSAKNLPEFRRTLGEFQWNRPFEVVCIDLARLVCALERELVCTSQSKPGLVGSIKYLICTWRSVWKCRWWSRTLCFGDRPGVVDPPFQPTSGPS